MTDTPKSQVLKIDERQHVAGSYMRLGGSDSDYWNHARANQVVTSLWNTISDDTSSLGYSLALSRVLPGQYTYG